MNQLCKLCGRERQYLFLGMCATGHISTGEIARLTADEAECYKLAFLRMKDDNKKLRHSLENMLLLKGRIANMETQVEYEAHKVLKETQDLSVETE